MSSVQDGPSSSLFRPVPFRGNLSLSELGGAGVSDEMAAALEHAPRGACVGWGIPFEIEEPVLISRDVVSVELSPTTAQWLIFMHSSDLRPVTPGPDGFISPMRGDGQLAERAADYVMRYADGTEERVPIRRRHQVGVFGAWVERCFEAVAHHKPYPLRMQYGGPSSSPGWGWSQTRVVQPDAHYNYRPEWRNWLWAWENPHPEKAVAGIRFEPVSGTVLVFAISAGDASSLPWRWQTRRKACLMLPEGEPFLPGLDEDGLLQQVQLDMGQVISATPRLMYPNDAWPETYNNQIPEMSENEVLVEYTAHPDACFHLRNGQVIPVSQVESRQTETPLQLVPPAMQRVNLRTVERGSGQCVPVKLHVHGAWGEYLAPVDRHRILNPAFFEDYSVDFAHLKQSVLGIFPLAEPIHAHSCTYIPGETAIDLPLGKVYIEVSKGFEIRPVRTVVEVGPDTREIVVEIERVLPWRERGWVTADTHVHFLSALPALLEGSAEGVNVVNLLATQLGELMANVGDFDGQTTWGSKEAGGDGEYLVRVGTENRQNVLGHISLLGYSGRIIAPMTTGGPAESALGDPVEVLLTEWARQCKKQGGLVVLPHFAAWRAEDAAMIVGGEVDALEMTSWGNLYGGIDPYSLSDWYRYLNCGYHVAAVGGTDKMSASMPVGAVRTYARIDPHEPFTYDSWMEAVRRGETFVTYGPLLEFMVGGRPMGSHIELSSNGGTVDVTWQVASLTIPMSRVELIVNGEIRESLAVSPDQGAGHWSVKVDKSSWLALLVRGHYADKPEIIVAHSSPVMISVEGSPMLAAADAVTILEQIEGALAYLDTVGTRAEDVAYKRMRLVLTSAHRTLHNRMHQQGYYHGHTPAANHSKHQ
ncbi:MAG TPA: CehA/McbA family metallohydrolase [Anaerolineae bacterium]|nr:CehA/McbA family metallohydrolase [Anaerolineae bacterium]